MKNRIVDFQDILKCSRHSILPDSWIPKHDCGDEKCPMRGK